jgi:hypothetical protein
MGKGKTTFLIDRIRRIDTEDQRKRWQTSGEHVSTKFLVVVPLLTEVDRFTSALPDLDFRDPQPIEGRKLHHLKTLVSEGIHREYDEYGFPVWPKDRRRRWEAGTD